jgi:integrase
MAIGQIKWNAAKVLRLTLKFAVKNRWLRRSPLTDDPLLVPKRRREVVIPTADEMARLEREIRRPNPRLTELNRDNLEAAFYIAQRATLRRGELAGLQWEHLNWETGQINVQSSYTKTRY